MISAERIPNNVGLSSNKRLQRALEHWQPKYIQWWKDMGPQGFQDYHQVYVRTAVSVDPAGWAHFEYVKLPEPALLLDARRFGVALRDDEAAQLIAELARHFLPDRLAHEIAKADPAGSPGRDRQWIGRTHVR